MTIGTSIILGSLLFTFTCHTPPQRNRLPCLEGSKKPAQSGLTRTGDTENRGSFRCGFCSGFYRGPHLVSNEREPLQKSVLTARRARRVPCSTLHRCPLFFPDPQCDPVTTTISHPGSTDLFGPPATAAGPSSSCLPSSCPEPRARASRAPAADRSAGRPAIPALRNHCASPVHRPACLSLHARQCACARAPCSRESACARLPDFQTRLIPWQTSHSIPEDSSA